VNCWCSEANFVVVTRFSASSWLSSSEVEAAEVSRTARPFAYVNQRETHKKESRNQPMDHKSIN
jgi:hypothetical protein